VRIDSDNPHLERDQHGFFCFRNGDAKSIEHPLLGGGEINVKFDIEPQKLEIKAQELGKLHIEYDNDLKMMLRSEHASHEQAWERVVDARGWFQSENVNGLNDLFKTFGKISVLI